MARGVSPARPSPAAAERVPASARRRWSWRTRLWIALAGWAIAVALRLVYRTLRVRCLDPADVFGARRHGQRVIGAFWHDGLTPTPRPPPPLACPGTVAAMLSWHRDAEIAGRALGRLGIGTVRGSSTRGWVGALRGLLAAEARGDDLAIVPDGPRGPRHAVQEGVVQLARATGLPVVAIGTAAWPARRLASWDRLQVPRPFARVAIVMSEPIVVSRRADAATLARAHGAVASALERATAAAAAAVGAPAT
jgi:hypothetical protein